MEILEWFPFTTEKKRTSIVLRMNGKIVLYSKVSRSWRIGSRELIPQYRRCFYLEMEEMNQLLVSSRIAAGKRYERTIIDHMIPRLMFAEKEISEEEYSSWKVAIG